MFNHFCIFSRMRSKGSRFTLGVWALRVYSLDVAKPFATVRNRPREGHMAVPMVSSAEGILFAGFKRLVASFRVAGVALRDIQTCFVTCRKSFCVAGAILLQHFQKMRCIFRGRRSTSDVSIVMLRGKRSTLYRRVVLHVFCKSHWQGCVKWRQGANSVARVVFCVTCWKVTEASRETSILRSQISGSWANLVGNRRFLKLQIVKIGGSFPRNACLSCFAAPTSRLESQVFRWLRRVHGGSCKTSPLRMFPTVKIGGCLARHARFGAPTCLVWSLRYSCGVAVSMGEAAKPLLFACFQLWKLADVSRDMLVLVLPRVSSGVSGFPVASPCPWGKLQNLSSSHVSNCENWRMSRAKCSFWCSHVSRLESLVFLWLRRVYGGSCKTFTFWRFPSRLSCRFAWQAWHFVTFQLVW